MPDRDLTPLLAPRSVAVVGASANLDSLAGKPVRYLRDSGLDLRIYPVNPRRDEIGGLRAYPDPTALPEAPDTAIVVVPAPIVVTALEQLAARGARSAIVVSSGFAELGGEGAAAQRRISEIAATSGMTVIGPNTLGVHDYSTGLALSFVWYGRRAVSSEGSVAVVSQSGSGMTSLCDRLLDAGLPLGSALATGNESDLTVIDVLEHLATQQHVRVIAMIVEQLRDGPRFLAACARLHERGVALVLLKAGRTDSGTAVVASHTGALAGSYPALQAVLRQYGVIEARDLDDIPGLVAAALPGKFPAGRRIAMVTSSGGAAALAADRADELGLELPPFPPDVVEELRAMLPSFAAGGEIANPIDLTAQSMERPHAIVDIAELLLARGGVDAVIAATPSGGGAPGATRGERLAAVAAASPRPLMTVVLTGGEATAMRTPLQEAGLPVFGSPGRAVEAIAKLAEHAAASPPAPGGRPAPGPQIDLGSDETEFAALRRLAAEGLPVIEQRVATTPAEAAGAAEALGFPVAVKIHSPDIVHKTEVGGVLLGLTDGDAVRAAFDQVTASAAASAPDARILGVTVAPMVTPVVELIAGLHRDPTFGPMVVLGLGGVWAEVLADISLRAVPVAAAEVPRMVDELRGAALLRGARGRPPVKVEALVDLVTTLSALAERAGPGLQGIDLNPVAVTADGGLLVLDASIHVTPTT